MRAITINAQDRTITEAEIDGLLESLQQIVGGLRLLGSISRQRHMASTYGIDGDRDNQ
jgi:hypothetical protein